MNAQEERGNIVVDGTAKRSETIDSKLASGSEKKKPI
jgi:hypothetical protein